MQARSLHLGIDYCRLNKCQLDSPVLDALAFAARAAGAAFKPLAAKAALLNSDATRTALAKAITDAAMLRNGDHLLLTFAGYGASVNQSSTNPAGLRAWRLKDQQLPLAVLFGSLERLAQGVRVCVISGCCYSGPLPADLEAKRRVLGQWPEQASDIEVATELLTDKQIAWMEENRNGDPGASIIHLAGCGVDETISDGTKGINTPFALTMLRALPAKNCIPFQSLADEMKQLAPKEPKPQIEPRGPVIQAFADQGPFCTT